MVLMIVITIYYFAHALIELLQVKRLGALPSGQGMRS